MENPFDNPTTIRDPKKLIGRDDQLRRILNLIKNHQSVAIVGPRRIGKTSLLTSLQDEETHKRLNFPGKDFFFFSIDLQTHVLKQKKNFFAVVNPIIKQQGQRYLAGLELADREENEEFAELLSEMASQGMHPVLVIDTFDELRRYEQADANLFNFLRALGTSGQVSYITASIDSLGKISLTDQLGSPFFNIFRTVQLGPFSEKEAKALLAIAEEEDLPFTEIEINWVLEKAGYHPYFLQQIGAALFEEKRVYGSEKMNFQRVTKEAYQNLEDHFLDSWRLLDRQEQKLLLQEAQTNHQEGTNHPELSGSELFREHLFMMYQSDEAPVTDMDIKQFEELLDNFDDPRVLGESALTQFSIIANQIPADKNEEPFARGMVVRELIRAAFEKMRGSDERKDEAVEWQLYNILDYRYFGKKHLAHKHIAARLGFSERHYYRFRKQAIRTLQKNLLEI